MKTSEANRIFLARQKMAKRYDHFSTKYDDGSGFSHDGCDCCRGGAGDVYTVTFLARADMNEGVFDKEHEGELCSGCLCALVNGDNSDLDFSVTEDDETALWRGNKRAKAKQKEIKDDDKKKAVKRMRALFLAASNRNPEKSTWDAKTVIGPWAGNLRLCK